MILRDKIEILKPTKTKDEIIGRIIATYPVDRTIKADFQPLSYNTQRKPYGITDKTSHMIFINDKSLMIAYYLPKEDPNQFNASYRIGFNNRQYSIDSILPYRNHFEIYVQVVI